MLKNHRHEIERRIDELGSFLRVIDTKITRHESYPQRENGGSNVVDTEGTWLNEIIEANNHFRNRITRAGTRWFESGAFPSFRNTP